jgi:threonyl-tRNA synthetase
LIEEFIRHKQKEFGFQEVVTPILGSKKLYEVSGHLEHYEKNMFPQVINEEGECFFLRPMTCPHHCLVFSRKLRSYKELPIRICENSVLHRYEPSGSLKGLERVRWMELSDHHVFVTTDGLKEEFKRSYSYVSEVLKHFNFKISRLVCSFSDLNEINKYHDDIDLWNYSENLLLEALVELKLEFVKLKGEAAFYGPKLDIEVETSDGKNVTIATIQIDFVLPKRFDLKYIEKDQKSNFPVIIHLSPIGTYQRFIAIMLEQTKGKIPF